MALIKSFEHKSMDRNSIHDGIDATYTKFERDGRKFIQVDSYGRAELPAVRIKSLVPALSSPNQRLFHSEPPRAGEQKRPAFSLPSPLCVRIRL